MASEMGRASYLTELPSPWDAEDQLSSALLSCSLSLGCDRSSPCPPWPISCPWPYPCLPQALPPSRSPSSVAHHPSLHSAADQGKVGRDIGSWNHPSLGCTASSGSPVPTGSGLGSAKGWWRASTNCGARKRAPSWGSSTPSSLISRLS